MVFMIKHKTGSQFFECDTFSQYMDKDEKGKTIFRIVIGRPNGSQKLEYGEDEKLEGYLMENGKTIEKVWWNASSK